MVVGFRSTIKSSIFGFQVCQGRHSQTRRWSWRSRNVHDCKFGRPVPWQGGGVSRMPGGRGTPATDSSSTTESHYSGLTSQLSKQSTKQTTNYPTGRQTQNARDWDLASALVQWLVHFLTFFEPQPSQTHFYYQLFLCCLTTFVNTSL